MAENIMSACQTVWGMLCAKGNHKGHMSMMALEGERPRWGGNGRIWRGWRGHSSTWWSCGCTLDLLREHSVEKQRVQTGAMGFFVLKKNKSIIENPKTKEEEKVEAKKEKLPEEKLPATSIKDQVTHKPLV